ncbi:MAG: rod shape-determining protein MreC [Terracidiphilus sp.]
MESLFERYRNLFVLLVMLLLQIVGLAMQVHRGDTGHMSLDPHDSGGVRLIRLWANAAVSPPERLFHSIGTSTSWIWHNYFDLRHVREQNQDLQQTVDRLRLEQAALLEDARQGERLQALLNFQEKYIYKTQAAQIIGTSGSDQSRLFYIDKGANAKLERDMAVITADGIVGKVREVYPRSAQVLLINDQTSGAGVILETTRIRGVLRGNAIGQPQIVGIMADSRIQPGERVLTAGGDEIFPRGLPVGFVQKVVPDPDEDGQIRVIVKPAAHLDRLDEVLVITSVEPRFPPDQTQDISTSEALKGAEAAEEKAQKKASEIMAERLPGLIDPNLPPDQQPRNDTSNPGYPTRPPMPLHPDRFTPDTSTNNGVSVTGSDATGKTAPDANASRKQATSPKKSEDSTGTAPAKPENDASPQRNP